MKHSRGRTIKQLAIGIARARMEARAKAQTQVGSRRVNVAAARVKGIYPEGWPIEMIRDAMYEKMANWLRLQRVCEPWKSGGGSVRRKRTLRGKRTV